jgi:methylenetetrahydrofolate dehydrogenase (NADP+)/methenyltetrahydrofolate cyclohydrolase
MQAVLAIKALEVFMAHIIDGKKLSQKILDEIRESIVTRHRQRPPGLATILVGENPASALYVANKRKAAVTCGMKSFHHELPKTIAEVELIDIIQKLNSDENIDGVLVQLPLPPHIRESKIIEAVDPKKDVDGFHPLNLGYLLCGDPHLVACTPLGIMYLIESVGYKVFGKHAVVVGKSTIVGKPMAQLLLNNEATVTVCHKNTQDLKAITRQADLLVVAAGSKNLIGRDDVKEGAFVVDVGINRDENNGICGDVNFAAVKDVASYITPVPGGVGPMTIAMLLKNTFENFLRNSR